MSMIKKPPVPRDLGAAGRKLWREVVADFELSPTELILLGETCRTLDAVELLAEGEDAGDLRVLRELRQQRLTLARLIAALRLPVQDDAAPVQQRTQLRSLRGFYGPRGIG
jgi:hypothetical protein